MKKLLFLAIASVLLMGTNASADATQDQRIATAIDVIKQLKIDPDLNISPKILQSAKAVAIIPNTVKSGFIFAGHEGKGLFSMKHEDGSWSNPVFINFKGMSAGFQAGYQSTDLILVFRTTRSYQGFFDGKDMIEFTGDMSVVRGYKGAGMTDLPELSAEVFALGRSTGLFMGVSLEGSRISIDDQGNIDYLGRIFAKTSDLLSATPKDTRLTEAFHTALTNHF